MIQRVQTVYMSLIVILMTVMTFFPAITTDSSANPVLQGGWTSVALKGILMLMMIVSIFKYKNRSTQLKICYCSLLVLLLMYVSIYLNYRALLAYEEIKVIINFSICFPLICIILDILAILAIKRDNKIVKSLERLR